jgi:cytochrome c-type biogenesis protein CcmH
MHSLAQWTRLVVVTCALLAAPSAFAVQPDEILADPALEARARALSRELRCMVCQNQSIDDSDAPLARDLRILVRERLKAGDSDRQVLDFLTVRYGEFVLLRPRFAWDTAVLWFAPAVVLAVGAFGLLILARRRSREERQAGPAEPELSDAERARLAELLGESGKSTSQST